MQPSRRMRPSWSSRSLAGSALGGCHHRPHWGLESCRLRTRALDDERNSTFQSLQSLRTLNAPARNALTCPYEGRSPKGLNGSGLRQSPFPGPWPCSAPWPARRPPPASPRSPTGTTPGLWRHPASSFCPGRWSRSGPLRCPPCPHRREASLRVPGSLGCDRRRGSTLPPGQTCGRALRPLERLGVGGGRGGRARVGRASQVPPGAVRGP